MSVSDRAKHQIGMHGGTVVLIAIGLALITLSGAVFVLQSSGVEEVPTRQTDVQEFETALSHSALVTNGSALYDEGQLLEDAPRYFYRTTPVLDISVRTTAPEDRTVRIENRLVFTIRASADERDLFTRNRVLATEQTRVSSGELVTEASLNATAARADLDRIRSEVGALGSVNAQLRVESTYITESVEGDNWTGTLEGASPMQFAEQGYWVSDEVSASETRSITVGGETRSTGPNLVFVSILALVGIGFLSIAGYVAYWRRRRIDLESLKLRIDREQYDDWISGGDFPTGGDRQFVYIDSLEGLVDVAIDTNNRVIHDTDIEAFAVPDGNMVYYHAADPRSVSSWIGLG